jgi:hypothetical protein
MTLWPIRRRTSSAPTPCLSKTYILGQLSVIRGSKSSVSPLAVFRWIGRCKSATVGQRGFALATVAKGIVSQQSTSPGVGLGADRLQRAPFPLREFVSDRQAPRLQSAASRRAQVPVREINDGENE